MPMTTAVMAMVAIQPQMVSVQPRVKSPITFFCRAITMVTAITGTATTPLTTADQNSALIGSKWNRLKATPSSVATAMVA